MTTKVEFSNGVIEPLSIISSWKNSGPKKEMGCQTDKDIYQFDECETSSGICTEVMSDEVKEKHKGQTLLKFLCSAHRIVRQKKDYSDSIWKTRILDRRVTIDYSVTTNLEHELDADVVVECVIDKDNAETQTDSPQQSESLRSKNQEGDESKSSDMYPNLDKFLEKVLPLVEDVLVSNSQSRAFDGYELIQEDSSEDIILWKTLSVDLEKHKVVFPTWNKGSHYNGIITACHVTRNGARTYDIDYKDGSKLFSVREEYIRVIDEGEEVRARRMARRGSSVRNLKEKKPTLNLKEGVPVHAKVETKNGAKFYPGRVVRVNKHTGTVDVEIEGGQTERGLAQNDVLQGLDEGQQVEARRPFKIQLQCTGLCWNNTGNALAASYGRQDVVGWCDFPGAVCIWNVFSRTFDPDCPDFVLDFTSCITSLRFHPEIPSIIAAGSFNGEVIVWNLNQSERPLAVTSIEEYAHKEPVMDLDWVYDAHLRNFLLVSVGADGKVLFWTLANNLAFPTRGCTLSVGKNSRRHYPASHGGCTLSFSGSSASRRPKWLVVGEEGGGIVRGQISRIMQGPALTEELLKTKFNLDETFGALRRGEETFSHDAHVGPVNSIDCSPFHRSLFLSGGQDGSVRLYHILEKNALRQWDPAPAPGTPGVLSPYGAVTCVRFSKVRPQLFAVSSAEGFIYFYDLGSATSGPEAVLEAPSTQTEVGVRRSTKRVGFTAVAFNHKQRDLFAACDLSGKVYIWRLGWKLANKHNGEQTALDIVGNVYADI